MRLDSADCEDLASRDLYKAATYSSLNIAVIIFPYVGINKIEINDYPGPSVPGYFAN